MHRISRIAFAWTALWLACGLATPTMAQQPASLGDGPGVSPSAAAEVAVAPLKSPAADTPPSDSGKLSDLLKLDVEQLSKVPVTGPSHGTNLTSPSSQLDAAASRGAEPTTTGELLSQLPSVEVRRTSGINLDPRVRGYHSSQLNASANGITQLKTRVDIDSLFSQIDPGVVDNVTVIDGPYTSRWGPGFAFLVADLIAPPRFPGYAETHLSTNFVYGNNGQSIYSRDNVISGGKDWGVVFSYGLRNSNDYLPGGSEPLVPSAYQKWDGLFACSFDLDPATRLEFNYLRTEMNNVQLPGIVYDLNNSRNDQFNLRYIVQEDRRSPEQFVFQTWWNQTYYDGDATRWAKQQTFYHQFLTLPDYYENPVNTVGNGNLRSLGIRALCTIGDVDSVQWTVGTDWRRYEQRYTEAEYNPAGEIIYYGNIFGIPKSQMDDLGVFADILLPVSDDLSLNIGGRVDYCMPWVDRNDAVITEFTDPSEAYYSPGVYTPSTPLGMAYITGKHKLNEEYTLKLGSGFAMRSPGLSELYGDESYTPIARFGNSYVDGLSTLRPEKDLQFDVGLTRETKKFSCGVRGFYSFIWDYIAPVAAGIDPTAPDFIQAPRVLGRNFSYFPAVWRTDLGTANENADTCGAGYQYVNLQLATLFGGDLFGEFKLRDGLSLFGTMSYVRGTNESPVAFLMADSWYGPDGQIIRLGGSEGLPGIYPFNGSVGIRFFEPSEDRWMLEFSSRMVARQDHVAISLSEIPSSGYVTFAISSYYRLRKNLRLSLNMENLLNRDYSEPGSLAYVDRSGKVTFIKEPGFMALLGVEARL